MFGFATSGRGRGSREDGAIMVIVTIITIVVGILVIAVSTSILDSAKRSVNRADRVRLTSVLDDAARAYQRGLRTNMITERTQYVLDRDAVEQLIAADGTQLTILDDDHASIPDDYRQSDATVGVRKLGANEQVSIVPFKDDADAREDLTFTVRTKITDDRYSFWQVKQVDMPSTYAVGGRLTIYFQAWEAELDGSNASRDRLSRVEYNVGRFSDYQMLTNSTIRFGEGATINGPVHSNATSATVGVAVPDGDAIYADSSMVSCLDEPLITSTSGEIELPDCTHTADLAEGTNNIIDFSAARDSVASLANDCAISPDDAIHCLTDPLGRDHVIYVYQSKIYVYQDLTPDELRLQTNVWGVPPAVDTAAGDRVFDMASDKTIAILVDGNAFVWAYGLAALDLQEKFVGRVTIASRSTEGGGGNITLLTPVQTANPKEDVVGLIAHANIFIDPRPMYRTATGGYGGIVKECSVTNIDAAMIARTGGIKLPNIGDNPPVYPQWCDGASGTDADLRIVGSMSSHQAPVLSWTWNSGAQHGFAKREYAWNETLTENPPPYFPVLEDWEIGNSKEANDDCFTPTRRTDWNCR